MRLYKIVFAISLILCFQLANSYSQTSPVKNNQQEQEDLFVAKKAFEDGFYNISSGYLEEFLKRWPQSEYRQEVELLLGQSYFYQEKYLEALALFEKLHNAAGDSELKSASLYWMAEVQLKGRQFDKARALYQRLIADFPQSSYYVFSLYSMGWSWFEEGDYAKAVKVFKELIEKFSAHSLAEESSLKIAESLLHLKRYEELKKHLSSFTVNYPNSEKTALVLFYQAEADYYLGDFEKAEKGYEKLLDSTDDEQLKSLALQGKAWSYLKLDKLAEAEKIFATLAPLSDNVLLGKGVVAYKKGEIQKSLIYLDELIEKFPQSPLRLEAEVAKAESLYSLKRYEDAIAVYKKIIEVFSKNKEFNLYLDKVYFGLAWSNLKLGRLNPAIYAFQEIFDRTSDKNLKVSSLCQIADAYQEADKFTEALSFYDRVLKNYPDSFYVDYAQYQVGQTLLKMDNFSGAALAFRSLLRNFPQTEFRADAQYHLAYCYLKLENFPACLDQLKGLLGESKSSSYLKEAKYLLGLCRYNLGDFKEAQDTFKWVWRESSDEDDLSQRAQFYYYCSLYQMGKKDYALRKLKSYLAQYPHSDLAPEALLWLGKHYLRQKDLDMAKRYLQILTKDFPESPQLAQARFNLALISYEKEMFPEALKDFKSVARDSKALQYSSYIKIAEIYKRLLRFDEAISFLEKASSVAPKENLVSIQFKIGEYLEEAGKTEEAIEAYLKISYMHPDSTAWITKSYLRSAQILEKEGNFDRARKIYEKLLQLPVEEAKFAKEKIEWIEQEIQNSKLKNQR